jgi:hypothetical protein
MTPLLMSFPLFIFSLTYKKKHDGYYAYLGILRRRLKEEK